MKKLQILNILQPITQENKTVRPSFIAKKSFLNTRFEENYDL